MSTEYLTPDRSFDRTRASDRTCQGCGAHVTPQWQRVMGDNQNDVYACPQCSDNTELMRGKAARVEVDA